MINDKIETEKLCKEAKMMGKIEHIAMLGWWSINFTKKKYEFSDYLRSFTNLDCNEMDFNQFREIIHPEHRDRIIRNFALFITTGVYEEKYQILTKFGYRWINSKLGKKEINEDGDTVAYGYMRIMDDTEVALLNTNNLGEQIELSLDKYSSILDSLLHLLNNTDSDNAIHETLSDILKQYKGNRVYIFEYDLQKNVQSCTYEVCSEHCIPQKEFLKEVSFTDTPWWTAELNNKTPIILNTLEDLPKEASTEKEILMAQDIKSVIIVPLISKDKTFGYLGIDMVREHKIWSGLDKQWLFAVTNILGMCLELKHTYNMATEEKKRFSDLYENMPMGFVRVKPVYDENGKPKDFIYLETNKFVDKIITENNNIHVGKRASEITPIMHMLSDIYTSIKDNHVVSEDNYHIGDGKYYAYTSYATSTKDDEFVAIFHDNTEKIKAHNELIKNKIKLEKIFQNVPLGIEIYDKAGYLLEMNDADVELFGVVREDVIGKVNIFRNPNIPEEYIEELRNGKSINIELKYNYDSVKELNYFKTSLSSHKHLSVKSTTVYDNNGEIEYYIFVTSDNTETLNISDKLLNFELVFDSIAEFSEIGLCRYNPNKDEFLASDQWFNNMCLYKNSVKSFGELYQNLYKEDKKVIDDYLTDIINGSISSFRTEIKVKNGDRDKWLRCHYNRTKSDNSKNNDYEIVGLSIDITEIKNTELKLIEAKTKAEEADRLKSAFVANMSHEIRTPLNAIVGFSEMLVDSNDITEREQFISIIKLNNNLLLQLISDILDISRVESGIITISPEIIDVMTLCDEITCSNRIKLTNENVELIFENSISNCFIYADKNKLMQILTNLIGNAIKFTQKGFIKLGYTIENDSILFYVKDSGNGISKENLTKIFERFVKLNTFVQGSGLGLSICRSLAEKLGGTIWAESTIGEGSCFWLKLPYDKTLTGKKDENAATAISQISVEIVKNRENEKPTILVAEDRDSNYMLVSAILKKEYQLIRANDGKEAIELYKSVSPDMILMDMLMPTVDGREATITIRKMDKIIPIIAVTANAFDQDRKKALEIGCNDYISKPINAAMLRTLIKKYLR